MLKALRHKGTQKKVVGFVAVTVVLGFVVSLVVLSQDDKKTSVALAKLDGRNITTQEYLKSYRAVQHQMQWMYGDRMNEMRGRVNLKGEAWDRLLLLSHAKKERIHTSDAEVVDWITTQDTFKRKDVFDQKYYELFVERALRIDARTFEEEAREILTIKKINDLERDKISIPDDELKKLYQEERSDKNILYTVYPWENLKDQVPQPTDKDIEQLFSLVKDKLTTPDEIKLSYVNISKDQLESQKAALDDKGSLEELVTKYGLARHTTGYFSKKDSLPELSFFEVLSQAFVLPAGQESSWIRHDGGATKIKVEDKKTGHPMTADEASAELKGLITRQKTTELAVKKMNELKDKVRSGDFEAILKAEGLTVESTLYKKGLTLVVTPPEALDRAVGSLVEGQVSEPVETAKGILLAKVVKVSGMDEATFEKEKEAFREDVKLKRSEQAMMELLESLRKKLSLNLEAMKELFPSE